MPTRVLFVCLGNICRSPMAEFVLRDLVAKANLTTAIEVASAGTSGWHNGENMHIGTQQMLHAHQITAEGFHSRQIQPNDCQRYDHIIAMDDQNIAALQTFFQLNNATKIYKITDLIPEADMESVPDPYFSGNFAQTYDLIYQGCSAWLQQWQQQHT